MTNCAREDGVVGLVKLRGLLLLLVVVVVVDGGG